MAVEKPTGCARFANISLDRYAHLWVDDEVEALHAEILTQVSSCEDLAHALRNRFFLESARRFFDRYPNGVLVNLAAGLSHHPLLLDESVTCIEVERSAVIELKREAFARWVKSGEIPAREIEWVGCDLNDPVAISKLAADFHRRFNGRPTYLLMEGLLFFLEHAAIDAIFREFACRLATGSQIGSVSYESWVTKTRPYRRLIEFFDRTLHERDAAYSIIEDDFYTALPGLQLIEKSDARQIVEEDPSLLGPVSDIDDMLIESLYVLERV